MGGFSFRIFQATTAKQHITLKTFRCEISCAYWLAENVRVAFTFTCRPVPKPNRSSPYTYFFFFFFFFLLSCIQGLAPVPLEHWNHSRCALHFSYFRRDSGTKRTTGSATETKNCCFRNTNTANVMYASTICDRPYGSIAVGVYMVRVYASILAYSVQQEKKSAAVAASRVRTIHASHTRRSLYAVACRLINRVRVEYNKNTFHKYICCLVLRPRSTLATAACFHRRLHHIAAPYVRHSHRPVDVEFRIHSYHARHSHSRAHTSNSMVERRASHEFMTYDECRKCETAREREKKKQINSE